MASRQRKNRREVQAPPLAEPKGFSSLSKAEQVRYLQGLWDSISARPGEIPVPESAARCFAAFPTPCTSRWKATSSSCSLFCTRAGIRQSGSGDVVSVWR